MEIAKRIFRFYINSSIHVGLAVVCFTEISRLHLQIPLNVPLLWFVLLATVTGYNFVKYAGIARWKHQRLPGSLRVIQVFSLICFLGLVYFSFQIALEVLLLALLLGVLNLFYALPIFKKKNLRAVGGIKIYVIAIIWAGVTVLFPAIDYGLDFSGNLIFLLVQRFLYVLVLLIPFEIRDLQFDPPQLHTIAQRIGPKASRQLGIILLVIIALTNLFKRGVPMEVLVVDNIIYLLSAGLIWKASVDRHPYYTTFLVEGVPILWAILIWLVLI